MCQKCLAVGSLAVGIQNHHNSSMNVTVFLATHKSRRNETTQASAGCMSTAQVWPIPASASASAYSIQNSRNLRQEPMTFLVSLPFSSGPRLKPNSSKLPCLYILTGSEKMFWTVKVPPLALLRIVVFGTGDVGLIPITKTPRWCCWGHMPQSRIMAHMPAKIRGHPACAQPAFANCRMARLGVKSFLVVKHS